MKTRIISVFLTLCLLCSFLIFPVSATTAAGGECGDNLTWTLDGEGTLTVSGTGDMYAYSNSNVPWYSEKDAILSVVVESGVTGISDFAFAGCVNLTEVSLASSITAIGGYAFRDCKKLASIKLPSSLKTIGGSAFHNCDALTSLTIPSGVTKLGSPLAEGCEKLETIVFTGDCPEIGENSFRTGSSSLTVRYPVNNATWTADKMKNYGFSGGTVVWQYRGLNDKYLAAGNQNSNTGEYRWTLDYEGTLVFTGDTGNYDINNNRPAWYDYYAYIKKVVITGKVWSIGSDAFFGCEALTEVVIDSDYDVTIGEEAFAYCTGLKTVRVTGTLDDIGKYAFCGCSALNSVIFGRSVRNIGEGAFSTCDALERIFIPMYTSTMSIGTQAFAYCDNLKEISLPAERCKLAANLFTGSDALETVYLNSYSSSDQLTSTVNSAAFSGVTANVYYPRNSYNFVRGSSYFQFGGNLTWIESDYGTCGPDTYWSYDPDAKRLTVSGAGAPSGTYDSGSRVPWYGLREELKHITVASGITYIPSYTFEYQESVETVELPETLTKLHLAAFQDCGSLNNLMLPASLRSIVASYDMCFLRCESLTDLYYFGTAEEWAAVENASRVYNYSLDMTIHLLELADGAATCTQPGSEPYYYFAGSDVYTDKYDLNKNKITEVSTTPALGHDWTEWEETAATCTEDGSKTRSCQRDGCGETEEEKISATGHAHQAVVTAPTCTEDGYTTYTCHCGDSYVDDEVAALGHDWTAWEGTDATCTEDGSKTRSCQRDGCDETKTEVISATGHNHEAVVTAPSCTAGGYTIHTCANCGDSYTSDETPATGHSYENDVCALCGKARGGSRDSLRRR